MSVACLDLSYSVTFRVKKVKDEKKDNLTPVVLKNIPTEDYSEEEDEEGGGWGGWEEGRGGRREEEGCGEGDLEGGAGCERMLHVCAIIHACVPYQRVNMVTIPYQRVNMVSTPEMCMW